MQEYPSGSAPALKKLPIILLGMFMFKHKIMFVILVVIASHRKKKISKSSSKYVSTLSLGGLTHASTECCDYVELISAYLDTSSAIIRNFNVPARKAGEEIL